MNELDRLKNNYLSNVKTLNAEDRKNSLKVIEKKYEKCRELSDEKVQLANQTYEMVDKHIRRLDADLLRFESELKDKAAPSEMENTSLLEKTNLKASNLNSSIASQSASVKSDMSKLKIELMSF